MPLEFILQELEHAQTAQPVIKRVIKSTYCPECKKVTRFAGYLDVETNYVDHVCTECHLISWSGYDWSSPVYLTSRGNIHASTLVNGLLCGFPLCCVLFYCSIVDWIWRNNDEIGSDFRPIYRLIASKASRQGEGYLMCPECAIRQWVS